MLFFALALTVASFEPPEMIATETELEATKPYGEQERSIALDLLRWRIRIWSECLSNATRDLSRSTEDAAYVANAVLNRCTYQEDGLTHAISRTMWGAMPRWTADSNAMNSLRQMRADYRDKVIGWIVEARLNAPKAKQREGR